MKIIHSKSFFVFQFYMIKFFSSMWSINSLSLLGVLPITFRRRSTALSMAQKVLYDLVFSHLTTPALSSLPYLCVVDMQPPWTCLAHSRLRDLVFVISSVWNVSPLNIWVAYCLFYSKWSFRWVTPSKIVGLTSLRALSQYPYLALFFHSMFHYLEL